MITKKYYKLIRVSHADSEYFRITNISNEIGEFKLLGGSGTMEYSLDGVNWTSYNVSTKPAVNVNPNSNIYLRGTGFKNNSSGCIDFNKDYTVGGNFMSLSNYATMSSVTTIDSNNYILSAFQNQTHLTSAQNLNFGVVTSVGSNGMQYMFNGCRYLTSAPDLSGITTVGQNGMSFMFYSCTALTTAPDLSGVTSVDISGMSNMFNGCRALITAPDLSGVTSVGNGGMGTMFNDCRALITAPDLSGITTVGQSGISEMFYNCYKLSTVTAPNINPWDTTKTGSWLNNAGTQATGTKTIYCPTGVEIPTNNNSGIPSGWTRVDY